MYKGEDPTRYDKEQKEITKQKEKPYLMEEFVDPASGQKYPSELAYFHDQKTNPGFDSESGVIYAPGTPEHKKYLQFLEKIKLNQEIGTESMLIGDLKKTYDQINEARLEDSDKNDQTQIELLTKKKEVAMNLLADVLNNVLNYIKTIRDLDETKIKRDSMDQQKFISLLEESDRSRKIAHNTLINSINAALRFIRFNFGDLTAKQLEILEEKLDEQGEEMLMVKRQKMPRNIFLPDNVDVSNRKHIMGWAIQIYDTITKEKGFLKN